MAKLRYKPAFVAICKAAVATGARRGELIAATWADLDLGRGRLRIRHTFNPVDGLTAPKDNEARTLNLVPAAVRLFEEWVAQVGVRPGIPLVGDNGRPRRPLHAFCACFARICREASLDPAELGRGSFLVRPRVGENARVPAYMVNEDAVRHAKRLIDARQYVLRSRWQDAQPRAREQNAFLKTHSWEEYAAWHLGLSEGVAEETKARYAFVYGDLRRLHRMGLIACHYRAAEWRHKEIELAAHELLQYLDRKTA